MAILGDIFRVLLKVFCGSEQASDQQQQEPQHQAGQQPHVGYPHKPQQPLEPIPHVDKPQHSTSPSPQHPSVHPLPPHLSQHHQDANQINQHNEHYLSLRARANEEGDQMAKCFELSHQAYSGGDGAGAKESSNRGREHQRKMKALNKEASDWIFVENNKDSKPGEIDLHGLYVKEAIAHTDQAIQEAKRRGDSEIHIIVGKGLHSPGGAAKIKPAIEELMQSHQLIAELDPENAGVLIVHMGGRGDGTRRGVIGSEDITRRLGRDDEECVIM